MFRSVILFFVLTIYSFSSILSTEAEILNYAEAGCYERYPNALNFDIVITSSTYYTQFDIQSYDCDGDYFSSTSYDSEIDKVVAITSCQVGDVNASRLSRVTQSHIDFTCGGCQVPQSSAGTSYQFSYFSQSECTASTLQIYYEQSEPTSVYEIEDAKWVDCFGDYGYNGCYFNLKLKDVSTDGNDTVDTNTTDLNGAIPDDDTSNGTSIDTSAMEASLQRIEDNTRDSASHLVDIANSLDFIADRNFSIDIAYRSYDLDVNNTRYDANQTFNNILSNAGLDFNESNGSLFDTYTSSVKDFHNSVYGDLLDDNGTYSIKTLFGDVLTMVSSFSESNNPFLFLESKSSSSYFDDIVISYRHPSVSWLSWDITITSDFLFGADMASFWFMIRIFLIFFSVFYGFMILVEGL